MKSCKVLESAELSVWDGYIFTTSEGVRRIPNHAFSDNKLHPPMMANTHSEELQETPNLDLFDYGDTILFVSNKLISGSEMLLANYGASYGADLLRERTTQRMKAIEDFETERSKRHNISHSFKCKYCEHRCQPKYALKHFKICNERINIEK